MRGTVKRMAVESDPRAPGDNAQPPRSALRVRLQNGLRCAKKRSTSCESPHSDFPHAGRPHCTSLHL